MYFDHLHEILNLQGVSDALQGVIIRNQDYKNSESFIDNKTFVYLDHPYRPLSTTFSYTANKRVD
ncbi:MAG: DNA adenine methylase [Anaerolineaceae bacterium]|nr:DNA adenine methylase [Anaerolineaceae bacterium]